MTRDEIERHYVQASRRFEEPHSLGMSEITDAGYWGLYDPAKVERAMDMFREAIAMWPRRAYPHSCLGEGFERTGDLEQALVHMQRGLELARANGVADLPYYEGMVNRERAKLGG